MKLLNTNCSNSAASLSSPATSTCSNSPLRTPDHQTLPAFIVNKSFLEEPTDMNFSLENVVDDACNQINYGIPFSSTLSNSEANAGQLQEEMALQTGLFTGFDTFCSANDALISSSFDPVNAGLTSPSFCSVSAGLISSSFNSVSAGLTSPSFCSVSAGFQLPPQSTSSTFDSVGVGLTTHSVSNCLSEFPVNYDQANQATSIDNPTAVEPSYLELNYAPPDGSSHNERSSFGGSFSQEDGGRDFDWQVSTQLRKTLEENSQNKFNDMDRPMDRSELPSADDNSIFFSGIEELAKTITESCHVGEFAHQPQSFNDNFHQSSNNPLQFSEFQLESQVSNNWEPYSANSSAFSQKDLQSLDYSKSENACPSLNTSSNMEVPVQQITKPENSSAIINIGNISRDLIGETESGESTERSLENASPGLTTSDSSPRNESSDVTSASKPHVMKLKRFPGSKKFYVSSESSSSGNNLMRASDDEDDMLPIAPNQLRNVKLQSQTSRSKKSDSSEKIAKLSSNNRTNSKICGVCGDAAKSMHFGGMACDSCKAFFRRSVQGKYWKKFRCSVKKTCNINQATRRNCQYCRFISCRKNGMKISWVMTEEERLVLWKKRVTKHSPEDTEDDGAFSPRTSDSPSRGRLRLTSKGDQTDSDSEDTTTGKQLRLNRKKVHRCKCSKQDMSESVVPLPRASVAVCFSGGGRFIFDRKILGTTTSTCSADHPLSQNDVDTMNKILKLQNEIFFGHKFSKSCEGNTAEAMGHIYLSLCQALCSFLRSIDDIFAIPVEDRYVLWQSNFIPALMIHTLYIFDGENQSWPRKTCTKTLKVPFISADSLMKFFNSAYAFDKLMAFNLTYSQHMRDEGLLPLMTILAITHEDDSRYQLKDKSAVLMCREKYLQILIRYLRYRLGERGSALILPQLLSCLEEARTVAMITRLARVATNAPKVTYPNPSINAAASMQEIIPQSFTQGPSVLSVTENATASNYNVEYHGSRRLQLSLSETEKTSGQKTLAAFSPPAHTKRTKKHKDEKQLSICQKQLGNNNGEVNGILECNQEDDPQEMDWQVDERLQPRSAGSSSSNADRDNFDGNKVPAYAKTLSEEKQLGIKVLCEMLQHVVQSDDPEMTISLRKYLPSQLLQKISTTQEK
ncbi:uncharacterized protein LOC108672668 [Hyalella azteca]|uniref:Uncharacterized protein LOC108672668 n=1 Tax=Hyalella azteca TaxID=294128 RepID=A0A8B7NQ75_HYAAZ|nr:uncharacterized protein LOC108672668 [Hyalella azteca]XP_018015862.1 uncharacterized protein LOC108672668 [Hyalella azteca]